MIATCGRCPFFKLLSFEERNRAGHIVDGWCNFDPPHSVSSAAEHRVVRPIQASRKSCSLAMYLPGHGETNDAT